MFNNPTGQREALLKEYKHTDCSAPDLELIQEIYDVFYQQKTTGQARHRFRRRHEVIGSEAGAEGIELLVRNWESGHTGSTRYDAVVLATGYVRDTHKQLFATVADYLPDFAINRHYQLCTKPAFKPAIFLQGSCEPTHVLSDTLLSILTARTSEICAALTAFYASSPCKREVTAP